MASESAFETPMENVAMVYVDGSYRGLLGGYGIFATLPELPHHLLVSQPLIGDGISGNYAEAAALNGGLKFALSVPIKYCVIVVDSQEVANGYNIRVPKPAKSASSRQKATIQKLWESILHKKVRLKDAGAFVCVQLRPRNSCFPMVMADALAKMATESMTPPLCSICNGACSCASLATVMKLVKEYISRQDALVARSEARQSEDIREDSVLENKNPTARQTNLDSQADGVRTSKLIAGLPRLDTIVEETRNLRTRLGQVIAGLEAFLSREECPLSKPSNSTTEALDAASTCQQHTPSNPVDDSLPGASEQLHDKGLAATKRLKQPASPPSQPEAPVVGPDVAPSLEQSNAPAPASGCSKSERTTSHEEVAPTTLQSPGSLARRPSSTLVVREPPNASSVRVESPATLPVSENSNAQSGTLDTKSPEKQESSSDHGTKKPVEEAYRNPSSPRSEAGKPQVLPEGNETQKPGSKPQPTESGTKRHTIQDDGQENMLSSHVPRVSSVSTPSADSEGAGGSSAKAMSHLQSQEPVVASNGETTADGEKGQKADNDVCSHVPGTLTNEPHAPRSDEGIVDTETAQPTEHDRSHMAMCTTASSRPGTDESSKLETPLSSASDAQPPSSGTDVGGCTLSRADCENLRVWDRPPFVVLRPLYGVHRRRWCRPWWGLVVLRSSTNSPVRLYIGIQRRFRRGALTGIPRCRKSTHRHIRCNRLRKVGVVRDPSRGGSRNVANGHSLKVTFAGTVSGYRTRKPCVALLPVVGLARRIRSTSFNSTCGCGTGHTAHRTHFVGAEAHLRGSRDGAARFGRPLRKRRGRKGVTARSAQMETSYEQASTGSDERPLPLQSERAGVPETSWLDDLVAAFQYYRQLAGSRLLGQD